MRLAIISFSIFLMAFSCASKKNASKTEDTVETKNPAMIKDTSTIIKFGKSYCFGKCPVYDLTIMVNGNAIYQPEAHTALEKGTYTSKIEEDIIKNIFTIAEEIAFFDFDSVYTDPYIQDLPSTFITLLDKSTNSLKSVEFVMKQPEGYKKLDEALRKIVDETAWVKKENSND